ncbi:MAG: RNA polymerase sigma factor [Paracoccaceae bacterium]
MRVVESGTEPGRAMARDEDRARAPARDEERARASTRGEEKVRASTHDEDAVDAELLAAVAYGDRAAFARLHERRFKAALRFLLRVTGRVEVAEEAACDAMLHVWRRAGDFRGESRVSTWIFGIAYRTAMNAVRKAERGERRVQGVEDLPAEVAAPEDGVETLLRRRQLAAALAALAPEQRALIELAYVHGYKLRDIAAITGLAEGTVKSRMFAARTRLRAVLEGKA